MQKIKTCFECVFIRFKDFELKFILNKMLKSNDIVLILKEESARMKLLLILVCLFYIGCVASEFVEKERKMENQLVEARQVSILGWEWSTAVYL